MTRWSCWPHVRNPTWAENTQVTEVKRTALRNIWSEDWSSPRDTRKQFSSFFIKSLADTYLIVTKQPVMQSSVKLEQVIARKGQVVLAHSQNAEKSQSVQFAFLVGRGKRESLVAPWNENDERRDKSRRRWSASIVQTNALILTNLFQQVTKSLVVLGTNR